MTAARSTLTFAAPPCPVGGRYALAPRPGDAPPGAPAGGLPWVAFFLLNAALFLRPEEFIPAVAGASVYQWCMLACLALSAGQLWRRVQARELASRPITLCVLGVLGSVLLSHLAHLRVADALQLGATFAKVVVYYLLVLSQLDTPTRIRRYLRWVAHFTLILTVLSVLQYHQVINLPALRTDPDVDEETIDPATGLPSVIQRLQSVGIFGNPNDFARLLDVGMLVALFELMQGRGVRRLYWLGGMAAMAYALKLTYSRGGLMAMVMGLGVLFCARYGWKKTFLLACVVLPPTLIFFGGRQTDLSTSEGTAQQRIQIWSDGIVLLHHAPLFGIGMEEYHHQVGYVAHNSFVHCYVELGLLGGTMFAGAFYLALAGLRQERKRLLYVTAGRASAADALGGSLVAILGSYVVGMLSSTRSYNELTYALLGVTAAYLDALGLSPPTRFTRVDGWLVRRVATVGIVVFVTLYVYVRIFARFSSHT